MTQKLKEAIDALSSLDALPEADQQSIAAGVLELVESAKRISSSSSEWGPMWRNMTKEERLKDLREWMDRFTDGPGLPDEALRRENIYD